jgi:hypothetical protein
MNFNDFSNVVQFSGLTPETHDFYMASFNRNMDHQGFLDHAHETIVDLPGIWFKTIGTVAYFVVIKDTVIPEKFADSVIKVEEEAANETPASGE